MNETPARQLMQAKKRKEVETLSDSAIRRIRQGIARTTIRWFAWLDYVMGIQNLEQRILEVVKKHGFGGVNFKDLMRFMHRSPSQVESTLLAMEDAKMVLVVRSRADTRWITPEHKNSPHPRILLRLFEGSDR